MSGARFLHPQSENASCQVDRDPPNLATGKLHDMFPCYTGVKLVTKG